MSGEFLEEARSLLEAWDRHPHKGNCRCPKFEKVLLSKLLLGKAAEILAVVDAAELATHRWAEANHEMGQASANERICEALETLDKKAAAL